MMKCWEAEEPWKAWREDNNRIKAKMTELFEKEVEICGKKKKWKSKHSIPISRVGKLIEKFFLYVDEPDYDMKWH